MKSKKSILAPENSRVESTDNSDVEFSENSRETKTAFNERLKKLISSILNYPTQFLISMYIVVHSGITISHLFDGNIFYRFRYYEMNTVDEEAIFLGFVTALFLFLVFRFYYEHKLKSLLIYSLFFNFGSMLLFALGVSIRMSGG
tara:strand:- start:69 stop:503 length:435 start_codon:yes stop_codon:yes gene_type:complete